VSDIHCLNALVSKFQRGREKCWKFIEKYDYVQTPKRDVVIAASISFISTAMTMLMGGPRTINCA